MTAERRMLADFPEPTLEEWRTLVEPELKGAPFEKRLVTRLLEGIAVQPLYTKADAPSADAVGIPGQTPFRRGATAVGEQPLGWNVVAEHRHPERDVCHRAIATDVTHGVDELRLSISPRLLDDPASRTDGCGCGCGGGILLNQLNDWDALLAGLDLGALPITLAAGPAFGPAAAMLAALWDRRGLAKERCRGSFFADPLGTLAARGRLPRAAETMLGEAADLAIATAKTRPNVTALGVSTIPYDNAGSTAVDELAIALSTTLATLRAVEDRGGTATLGCQQLSFLVAVGTDQFLDIAKLRAMRALLSRLYDICGIPEQAQAMRIMTRTSRRVLTARDPWVNILRATMGCFSSAVGGADRIIVLPFDDVLGPPDELAARIARNTQIVLREEAHLGASVDAAGGSFYVETLTRELAESAWTQMQAIEARGGILAVLRNGWLKEQIDQSHAKRQKDIAKRKTPVTGVSEFPHLGEQKVTRTAVDVKALLASTLARPLTGRSAELPAAQQGVKANPSDVPAQIRMAALGATYRELSVALGENPETVAAFPLRRFAQGFERLRDASDAFLAKHGKRPQVFFAAMGPIATHTARVTFAQNFFEAGGFEPLTNTGFATAEEAASAFSRSGTALVIICSSDAWYETGVLTLAAALKQAGAKTVLLAGNPGKNEAAYRAAGVDKFIYMGCDVEGALSELSSENGVQS